MSSYNSIQTSKIEAHVPQQHSKILTNETDFSDNDSSSTALVVISHNITTSPNTSDSNSTTDVASETQHCRRFFDRNCINLESHQLILLDKNISDIKQDETVLTLEELRKIVDYTKFINHIEEAVQYIEQTKQTATFLICSSSLGQIIVPQIHALENIQSIYMYCRDKQYRKQWSEDYTKVST